MGGAAAPPAGKWISGHYDAYNRQHTTTDHHRCLLYHAAPQRLRLRPAAPGSQFGGFVFALPCSSFNAKNRMNNQINGISPSNKLLVIYMEAGRGVAAYLENQISNEALYWAGR